MTPNVTQQLHEALKIVEDGPSHPDFDSAWECLAVTDHVAIRTAMRLAMEETFGPYPPPTGYSDAGEPFWATAIMSKYLGIPVEQIEATALELQDKWGSQVGIMETDKLHRVH